MKTISINFAVLALTVFSILVVSCKDGSNTSSKTYDNPFEYCKAIGTVDTPGAEYSGAKVPKSILDDLRGKIGVSDSMPMEIFEAGTSWRCMDGKVYACNVGNNLPCQEKADISKDPNDGMRKYCKENANAPFIPAFAAGRTTVYEWRCDNTNPVPGKQIIDADASGYQSNIWYEITPE